jgi:hypothetical protein
MMDFFFLFEGKAMTGSRDTRGRTEPQTLTFVALRLRPAPPQPAVARSNRRLQCNLHTYMLKSARACEEEMLA